MPPYSRAETPEHLIGATHAILFFERASDDLSDDPSLGFQFRNVGCEFGEGALGTRRNGRI